VTLSSSLRDRCVDLGIHRSERSRFQESKPNMKLTGSHPHTSPAHPRGPYWCVSFPDKSPSYHHPKCETSDEVFFVDRSSPTPSRARLPRPSHAHTIHPLIEFGHSAVENLLRRRCGFLSNVAFASRALCAGVNTADFHLPPHHLTRSPLPCRHKPARQTATSHPENPSQNAHLVVVDGMHRIIRVYADGLAARSLKFQNRNSLVGRPSRFGP